MRINYLQVYDYNLNISKRLNESIELLPNEWICLTDQDVLKFPNFFDNIKDLINSGNITKDDLTGTMVNRLRKGNPAVIEDLYDEDSIDVHFNKSIELWNENTTDVMTTKIVAGACMIFHKSLWTKIGGFDESKIFFDKYFSYAVNESGGKCLIAKGLYVFHLYRWGSEDPASSVHHLIPQK